MDFIEQLQSLSAKIQKQRDMIQTEEATKNAFILPFISTLGYDIFDPLEVIPEFTADVGTKKGEKVDYAIVREGKIILLFECKKCGTNLDESHASQLYRYFSVTDARIGVLTDGIVYRFYTDLEDPNKMDTKPFMELNLLDIQEPLVAELKRLTKSVFNLHEIITVAGELKYTREIKRILGEEFVAPSEEFVRLFATRVYSGRLTESAREQFAAITRRACMQFINERINERLKSAMTSEIGLPPAATAAVPESREGEMEQKEGVVTTAEELEGYYLVKAILRDVVEPSRVAYRDAHSYFAILLDNNNRKPICRLYFNRKRKAVGLFTAEKQEERIPINDLNDLYTYADRLRAILAAYEPKPA